MRPITALGISLAIALPWYIWVGIRTDGEFLRGFFVDHHLGRATKSMEGHGGSIWFYPVAILAGFFPWSVFALPVFLDSIRHSKQNTKWMNGYLFAACWIGVYVGLFSLAKTKLPSYVTPCYPALALATGCFVDRWTRNV
jgi:4-amino-4-deoxy-L-arabinose transferase-like glycosyltransferase